MPRRHTTFEPGMPLCQILSPQPDPINNAPSPFFSTQTPTSSSLNQSIAQNDRFRQTARLATLFYVNTVLWDYRADPAWGEAFLKKLALEIVRRDLDLNSQDSVETLLWILMRLDVEDGKTELRNEV